MTTMEKSGFAAGLFVLICAAPFAHSADEPAADVGKYLTFSFVAGDPKQAGVVADKQVRHRLQQMVTKQLMNKGYKPAAPGQRAELGINLAGRLVDKQRIFVVGNPTPYNYHRGRVEPGGYETVEYREGTVQVDFVDLAQSRLVWNTQFTQALSAGYSEENWKKVERALAGAFKALPNHH